MLFMQGMKHLYADVLQLAQIQHLGGNYKGPGLGKQAEIITEGALKKEM